MIGSPPRCPHSYHGAVKGKDAFTGLADLDGAVDCDQHALAAMDLTKAFDFMAPEAVVTILVHFGLPAPVARALSFLWSNQRRWLWWQAWAAEAPSVVTSSVPQGDGFYAGFACGSHCCSVR